jgi:hypothetical protein
MFSTTWLSHRSADLAHHQCALLCGRPFCWNFAWSLALEGERKPVLDVENAAANGLVPSSAVDEVMAGIKQSRSSTSGG